MFFKKLSIFTLLYVTFFTFISIEGMFKHSPDKAILKAKQSINILPIAKVIRSEKDEYIQRFEQEPKGLHRILSNDADAQKYLCKILLGDYASQANYKKDKFISSSSDSNDSSKSDIINKIK